MDDATGWGKPDAGRPYDAAAASSPELLGPAVVFWRAILASASKMEEPLGAAGAALLWGAASIPEGGLPGGVVETSARTRQVSQQLGHCQGIGQTGSGTCWARM